MTFRTIGIRWRTLVGIRAMIVSAVVGRLLMFLPWLPPAIRLAGDEPPVVGSVNSQEAGQSGDVPLAITFRNGDFVSGISLQTADADWVCWRAELFDRPVRHRRSPIASIRNVSRPADSGTMDDEFFFDLSGGEEVRGRMESWNQSEMVVESPDLGRVRIPADRLCLMRRVTAAGRLVYLGPGRPDEWQIEGSAEAWDLSGGVLAAQGAGALYGQVGIPERALVEIEFSWEPSANFVIEMATAPETNALARPFCIGMVGRQSKTFLTFRETDQAAEASVLDLPAASEERVVLRIFWISDSVNGASMIISGSS